MIIHLKTYVFHIKNQLINRILNIAVSDTEKIGYLFGYQIKDTNEIVIEEITEPHKNDISTQIFSKISRKHKKSGKKFIKKHVGWSNMGFFHTHPKSFGTQTSQIDAKEFARASKRRLKCFIIATENDISFYIYNKGDRMELNNGL